MRGRVAQISKLGLKFFRFRRRNGIEERNLSANKRIGHNNFAERKTTQSLHQRNDVVIRLPQKLEHDCGGADPVKIRQFRIFFSFVPLRYQTDDFALGQGFIEQFDRGRPPDI